MGRKGRSGSLPAWYVGRLILDDVDGSWEGERSGKLFKQRGLNITKKNFDSLTDEERQNEIQRRIR